MTKTCTCGLCRTQWRGEYIKVGVKLCPSCYGLKEGSVEYKNAELTGKLKDKNTYLFYLSLVVIVASVLAPPLAYLIGPWITILVMLVPMFIAFPALEIADE